MANRVVMPSIAILALIAALMLMREESVILEKGGSFWHAPRAAHARAAGAQPGHVAARRRAFEKRWRIAFPGRAWGEEPLCEVRTPAVRRESRAAWAERLLSAHKPALRAAGKGADGRLPGLRIGACSAPVPVPLWLRMRR